MCITHVRVQVPPRAPKRQRTRSVLCLFGIRVSGAGLEQGGGEAVKNSPVDCFSARGRVSPRATIVLQRESFRGMILFACVRISAHFKNIARIKTPCVIFDICRMRRSAGYAGQLPRRMSLQRKKCVRRGICGRIFVRCATRAIPVLPGNTRRRGRSDIARTGIAQPAHNRQNMSPYGCA